MNGKEAWKVYAGPQYSLALSKVLQGLKGLKFEPFNSLHVPHNLHIECATLIPPPPLHQDGKVYWWGKRLVPVPDKEDHIKEPGQLNTGNIAL